VRVLYTVKAGGTAGIFQYEQAHRRLFAFALASFIPYDTESSQPIAQCKIVESYIVQDSDKEFRSEPNGRQAGSGECRLGGRDAETNDC
jgi:hypothetical protein